MGNRRVFIGWNGPDNQELARMISNRLSEQNYFSIIGGEWRQSLTVSEEILHQMNGCDFAIILIEKETRRNNNGEIVSMGFNPNVMMELGYMLRKVKDPNRIRRILINMDHGELPSDLQGMWSVSIKKDKYDPEDCVAREEALSKAAAKIADDFFSYMKGYQNVNKLDYFDNWEENVIDIYHYSGDIRIADKLIYGLQAAIYSGEFGRLYGTLEKIKERLKVSDRFGDYGAVSCAMAILDVFIVTRRLTKTLDDDQFDTMREALETEYEKDIKDKDLKTWCRIFRKDKLELCYEFYAAGLNDEEEKIENLYDALDLCNEILGMIEEHLRLKAETDSTEVVGADSNDEKYALIYKAFTNRNISQIHKQLAVLEPDEAEEHIQLQKEYCARTLQNRRELHDYYKEGARENTLSMDFIMQEYILALTEQCRFETNPKVKKENIRTAKRIYGKWMERNKIRNMIFDKVSEELSSFLNSNE